MTGTSPNQPCLIRYGTYQILRTELLEGIPLADFPLVIEPDELILPGDDELITTNRVRVDAVQAHLLFFLFHKK